MKWPNALDRFFYPGKQSSTMELQKLQRIIHKTSKFFFVYFWKLYIRKFAKFKFPNSFFGIKRCLQKSMAIQTIRLEVTALSPFIPSVDKN